MKKKVPFNVWILSLVSLFNDIASEMIYPIVPIFLTTVLKTSVPVVGLIEGIAEATASITKYIFGSLSDYFQKRKIFVTAGYFFGAVSKILIGLAYSWPLVLFAKFIDRSGKGLRTAPRDSILLENTTASNKGFIFGFHRALDSLGAVIGPLLGLLLLIILKENVRLVFFLAFIPAFVGIILLLIFVKEKKKKVLPTERKKIFVINWKNIRPQLKIFLVISFIFSLGNSSDAFILLKAKSLGMSTTLVVLSYVLYNIFQTVFAAPAGNLADKIGAKRVFAIGLLVFSIAYLFFGLVKNSVWFWFLFPFYGIYIAFTDGVSKAYISQFITQKESGSYFGLHQTLIAVGNFMASFMGGIIWSKINPSATFYYGSLTAATAFIALIFFRNKLKSNK